MYSYGLLETGCYYLVQEKLDSSITLIKATMESDHCMYVFTYNDEMVTGWKRKTDKIYSEPEDTSAELKPLVEHVAEIVLRRRTAVCDGYTKLFKALCDHAGVQNEIISSPVFNR